MENYNNVNKEIERVINKLYKQFGSYTKMAESLGVSRRQVSRWCMHESTPSALTYCNMLALID